MKKLLVAACVILGVAFLSSFAYTAYFTATHSNKADSNVQQDCGHDEQIQELMRQIATQQSRINFYTELVDLYSRVMVEFENAFETQYEVINEILGQMSFYDELIESLNSQIDTMQNLISEHEATIDNLRNELDFWLEADIDNPELLQELVSQNNALLAQIETLENDLQSLQTDFDTLYASFNELTEAMLELTQDNTTLNELVNELQSVINELNETIEYYKNQAPQEDFYSDLGRTKNFVNPINIMETDNQVFLWQHFDTQVFLDMLLWEWGDPFFGPTLIGYYVAFEFSIQTSSGPYEYAVEIIHDAGYNPMARAFKNGVLQTQSDAPIFDISLTPVTFSYTFKPLLNTEISAMYLNRLTFVHLAPWRGEA